MRSATLIVGVVLVVALYSSGDHMPYAQEASAVKVAELYKANLAEAPGKEARILQLEIAPGGHVGWHYHPGDACAYVQEGSMVLVPRGKTPVTMNQGETGCVAPRAVHDDKNASQTAPVKFLVFFVTEKGQPFAVPVK
ncbi:MAG TPA: cupin domain-containing protein [Candidatus Acidoferrales bacterium]|nr:cupin domain-containing protein [Candidatus Acidoferrales bacterium]